MNQRIDSRSWRFSTFKIPPPEKRAELSVPNNRKNAEIDSVISMVCIFEDLFLKICPPLPGQPFCEVAASIFDEIGTARHQGSPGGANFDRPSMLRGKSKMADPKICVSPVPILPRASRFRPSATLTFESFEFLLSSIPSSCTPRPPQEFLGRNSDDGCCPFRNQHPPFFL